MAILKDNHTPAPEKQKEDEEVEKELAVVSVLTWWEELHYEVRNYLTRKYYSKFLEMRYPNLIKYQCHIVLSINKINEIFIKERL